MKQSCYDVALVGGGVIGLSAGILLGEAGLKVAIFDKGQFGQESSWAGAGILAPPECSSQSGPADQFRSHSIRGLMDFSNHLQEFTGINNQLIRCGGWIMPETGEDPSKWPHDWATNGIPFEELEPGKAIPSLNQALFGSSTVFWFPGKSQVRNPRHIKAMLARLDQIGVELFPEEAVQEWDFSTTGKVVGFSTTKASYTAGKMILCSGAWSGKLASSIGLLLPVKPVKGQMVVFQAPTGFLGGVFEKGKQYLVPRVDGKILCGSTEEETGFDKSENPDSIRFLKSWAISHFPALANFEVIHTWTGLRPGSLDGQPYIGPVQDHPEVLVATGHFRSGVQLSWGTADVLQSLVTEQYPKVPWEPFLPSRPEGPLESSFKN